MLSEEKGVEVGLLSLFLLLLLLSLRSALIEFDSANGTAVVILKPVSKASAVECVLAGQLAAILSILALFEADIALRVFVFIFLR